MAGVLELGMAVAAGSVAAGSVGICGISHLHQHVNKAKSLPKLATHAFTGPTDSCKNFRAGLEEPTDVTCQVNGKPAVKAQAALRGEVVFLGDKPALAVGGGNFTVSGETISIRTLPKDVTLTFKSDAEAKQWEHKLKKATEMSSPPERIDELVNHVIRQEALLRDFEGEVKKKEEELANLRERLANKKKTRRREDGEGDDGGMHAPDAERAPQNNHVLEIQAENEAAMRNLEGERSRAEARAETAGAERDHHAQLASQFQARATELEDLHHEKDRHAERLAAQLVDLQAERTELHGRLRDHEAERTDFHNRLRDQEERYNALITEQEARNNGALRELDLDANAEVARRCAEEREAVRREFDAEYGRMRLELEKRELEAQGHTRSFAALASERDQHAARVQELEAQFMQHISDADAQRQALDAEHQSLRLQVEEANRAWSQQAQEAASRRQTHQEQELELAAARRQVEETNQQARAYMQAHEKALADTDELRELLAQHRNAHELLRQENEQLARGGVQNAGVDPGERELLSKLQEENEMLKSQMVSTWAQINSQMAIVDAERNRYLEEVRNVSMREREPPNYSKGGSGLANAYVGAGVPMSAPSSSRQFQAGDFRGLGESFGEASAPPRAVLAGRPPPAQAQPSPMYNRGGSPMAPLTSPTQSSPMPRHSPLHARPSSQSWSPELLADASPNLRPVLPGAPPVPTRRQDPMLQQSMQRRQLSNSRITSMPPRTSSAIPTLPY